MYKVRISIVTDDQEVANWVTVPRNPEGPSKMIKPNGDPVEFELFPDNHRDFLEFFMTDEEAK